jgi:hypothetical protein
MTTRLFILCLMIGLTPSISLAQGNDARERGERACKADVTRHCQKVIEQGDMAILQCLQSNRTKLRANCTAFLKEVGQLH